MTNEQLPYTYNLLLAAGMVIVQMCYRLFTGPTLRVWQQSIIFSGCFTVELKVWVAV